MQERQYHVFNKLFLINARRLWFWAGAASLSQLAMEGTSKPLECKFPCEVNRVELMEAIEILDVTEKARISIKEVPIWNYQLVIVLIFLKK